MNKSWTEERRQKQAERIRQQKPWEKSTGPKSKAGKAISSRNATKHGQRSIVSIEAKKALKLHQLATQQSLYVIALTQIIKEFPMQQFVLKSNEVKEIIFKSTGTPTPPKKTNETN